MDTPEDKSFVRLTYISWENPMPVQTALSVFFLHNDLALAVIISFSVGAGGEVLNDKFARRIAN